MIDGQKGECTWTETSAGSVLGRGHREGSLSAGAGQREGGLSASLWAKGPLQGEGPPCCVLRPEHIRVKTGPPGAAQSPGSAPQPAPRPPGSPSPTRSSGNTYQVPAFLLGSSNRSEEPSPSKGPSHLMGPWARPDAGSYHPAPHTLRPTWPWAAPRTPTAFAPVTPSTCSAFRVTPSWLVSSLHSGLCADVTLSRSPPSPLV